MNDIRKEQMKKDKIWTENKSDDADDYDNDDDSERVKTVEGRQ